MTANETEIETLVGSANLANSPVTQDGVIQFGETKKAQEKLGLFILHTFMHLKLY